MSGAQVVPEISIDGQPFATIAEAMAAAVAGDVVVIGPGTLSLTTPVVVTAAITIEGASAGSTRLDATGLEAGIHISAGSAGDEPGASPQPTTVRGLQVFGAGRGIDVSGAHGVVIRNVVLRDNVESGLYVGAGADVTLANGTLVRNGTAVVVVGTARVRNSIITGGGGALSAAALGALLSSYNDIFAIGGPAYQHVLRGKGDLAFAASFTAFDDNDFHLAPAQPITDRGDPADEFAREPQPNGGRINLGAFGNTAEAETSKPVDPSSGGGCSIADGSKGSAGEQFSPWVLAIFGGAGLLVLAQSRHRPPCAIRCRCRPSRAGCPS